MALLQLHVLQAAGGAVFGTSSVNGSNGSMSFLWSTSHTGVRSYRCSCPHPLGERCRQSSCSPWPHVWRPSRENVLISFHRRVSGYAIVASQEFYASASRPDFRRKHGHDQFSSLQRSSSGGRGGGQRSLAESTFPKEELNRLIMLGLQTGRPMRLGRCEFITNRTVQWIHKRWRNSEVVRIEGKGPLLHYKENIHKILEAKTGGLVLWKSAGAYILYRGKDYVPPYLDGNEES